MLLLQQLHTHTHIKDVKRGKRLSYGATRCKKLLLLEPFFCCVSFAGLVGTHAPPPILHSARSFVTGSGGGRRPPIGAIHTGLHRICFCVARQCDSVLVYVRQLGNAVSHPAPKELSSGIGSDKKLRLHNEWPPERAASFFGNMTLSVRQFPRHLLLV